LDAVADAYIIVDSETGKIWDNGRHKKTWEKPGYAKNAWNVGRYRQPQFNEQTRFVCRPVRFIDMETGHYFT
jgi:hypothetical protein